jgi:hypothetical protein
MILKSAIEVADLKDGSEVFLKPKKELEPRMDTDSHGSSKRDHDSADHPWGESRFIHSVKEAG